MKDIFDLSEMSDGYYYGKIHRVESEGENPIIWTQVEERNIRKPYYESNNFFCRRDTFNLYKSVYPNKTLPTTAREILRWLGETLPYVEVEIEKGGLIKVFLRVITQEEYLSRTRNVEPTNGEKEEVLKNTLFFMDGHYFRGILGKKVRHRECNEDADPLIPPSYCLSTSGLYGWRFGLSKDEADQREAARKAGKPWEEG